MEIPLSSSEKTIPGADAARAADITVFAVGIGKKGWVGLDEINGIASDPDSQYAYLLEKEEEIDQTANDILDLICVAL